MSGTLCAVDREIVVQQPSLFNQYRAVDVTMYDLIYGLYLFAVNDKIGPSTYLSCCR